jgi:spermidine/putrescine transport system permease protein
MMSESVIDNSYKDAAINESGENQKAPPLKNNPIKKLFSRLTSRFRLHRKHYVIPYVILLCVFVIMPLLLMIFRSFRHDITGEFTLENYGQLFSNAGNWRVMGRSFYTAALVTVLCLLLAYPVALILSNPKFNRSAVIIFVFALPMWVNILLRTLALRNLFDIIGLQPGYLAVVIGLVYDFFPFMLLPLYTSLSSIDKSYTEAGADLGAGTLRNFARVTLPLSVPGIVSGSILIFMATVSNFAISDLLGNHSTLMFGNIINNWFVSDRTYNLGSAFATVLLIIIVASMLITSKLSRDKGVNAKGGRI